MSSHENYLLIFFKPFIMKSVIIYVKEIVIKRLIASDGKQFYLIVGVMWSASAERKE